MLPSLSHTWQRCSRRIAVLTEWQHQGPTERLINAGGGHFHNIRGAGISCVLTVSLRYLREGGVEHRGTTHRKRETIRRSGAWIAPLPELHIWQWKNARSV